MLFDPICRVPRPMGYSTDLQYDIAMLPTVSGETVGLGVEKPKHHHFGKPKRVDPSPDRKALARASTEAAYAASRYHCRGPKGEKPIVRAKPASICPRSWSNEEATRTLRHAIAGGRVSESWEHGFPRYVWHRDGDVLYEARHSNGPIGSFHAYPIEDFQAPKGLEP